MTKITSAFAAGVAALIVGCFGATSSPATVADAEYDLVLRNARIVDGTGSPWFRADLAIRGDTIARIAPAITGPARRVIDLGGLVAAPGFIDVHTHAGRAIFQVPTADNYIRQGVTMIMEGADGAGPSMSGSPPVPLKPWLDKLEALPKSINIGSFVGQGAVRAAVIGQENRPATPAELDRMRALVLQDMKDGAFGLSTGLFYVPGAFTPLAEVVELQKVVAPFHGLHTSHMRDEAAGVVDSVRETIAIGEQGGVPTQVSHHKMIGKSNWGRSVETLKLIDAARARGVDATLDQYPYTASSTTIQAALLPKWALEGGLKQTIARLKDPVARAKIKTETAAIIMNERGGGDPRNVAISLCEWDVSLGGKNLADIAQSRGLAPTVENAAEVTLWLVENGGCGGVFHAIGEEDVQRVMAHPATMIASDGQVVVFGMGVPHPRSYGTFARVLGVYVREKGVITLEDAVRKMTSFPASRLGLPDRGVLRAGMKADIAVFDPARVKDMATFDKPHQYAAGFAYVIVNGQIAYEGGAMTAARPGRVIYGAGKTSDQR
jgi:dihydroorotase/N-acyl-D-amino-acid deacylase